MSLLNKLLKWDEMRIQRDAANEVSLELAHENAELLIENEELKAKLRQHEQYPYKVMGECTAELRDHFNLGYIESSMGGLQALCVTVAKVCNKGCKFTDDGVEFYG